MLRKHWRFAAALAIQLAILVAVPGRQALARLRGTEITLRTRPVDPYDLLSGYYVTLAYEAETAPGDLAGAEPGEPLWIVVEHGLPAWRGVEVTREKPAPASGRVAIRARASQRGPRTGPVRIEGAGRFYVPEARRAEVERALRDARSALVDLRVGEDGSVALLRLRAGDVTIEE